MEFKGTRLTELALAQRSQANQDRSFDLQERQLNQADQRIQLGQGQLAIAARQLGMSEQEFQVQLFQEVIGNSPDADTAISFLSQISPVAPEAEAQIRSMDPEVFGFAQRQRIPAGTREFDSMVDAAALSPEERAQAARVDLGLDPRAVAPQVVRTDAGVDLVDRNTGGSQTLTTGEELAAGAGQVQQAKTRATASEGRLGDAITEGMVAADSLATINRAIELIDSGVDTGRLAATQLAFMQSLGIEDPQAGELSNLLGKAVLSQLRSTFGAAFTQEEGQRLQDIEASFGRNPATNMALLRNAQQIAKRAAERGLQAATEVGDSFSIEQINQAINFKLGSEPTLETASEPTLEELMAEKERRAQSR